MKDSTRRRKQIGTVSDWLAKARPDIEKATHANGWQPEFSLLISVEQLVKYAELAEQTIMFLEAENKELRSLWIENEGDIIETRTELKARMQIMADGLIVSPRMYGRDEMIFAEVVPSGYGKWWRRWLPWVGNWWFEIHSTEATLAYEKGGSGGAYTLSGCIRKAMVAVDKFETAKWKEDKQPAAQVAKDLFGPKKD